LKVFLYKSAPIMSLNWLQVVALLKTVIIRFVFNLNNFTPHMTIS
jgi:hypothetical protein